MTGPLQFSRTARVGRAIRRTTSRRLAFFLTVTTASLAGCSLPHGRGPGSGLVATREGEAPISSPRPTPTRTTQRPIEWAGLPDVSGLAWAGGDRFLAVHDVKSDSDEPRVSLITIPGGRAGLRWRALDELSFAWPPPLGRSSDLEEVTRIPGSDDYLLVESGSSKWHTKDDFGSYRRVFQVRLEGDALRMVGFAQMPVRERAAGDGIGVAENVEGAAVVRIGERTWFVYADRAEDQPKTVLGWAELTPAGPGRDLSLGPLPLGQQADLALPNPPGTHHRHVAALAAGADGSLYASSTCDPNPGNADDGPFLSAIWRIGRLEPGPGGAVRFTAEQPPRLIARVDGLKVEGLTIRDAPGPGDTGPQLFFATDDENYGGAVRWLPLPAPTTRPAESGEVRGTAPSSPGRGPG